MTQDISDAEDLTHEVFVQLFRTIGSFRGESAFSTWLYRLVVNACIDRSRGRRKDTVDDPVVLARIAIPSSQEEMFGQHEIAESVQQAIAVLPAKLRAAVLLRYFDDLSYADMAKALNCSIGTVASRLSRGHRLLARTLAPIRAAVGQIPPRV